MDANRAMLIRSVKSLDLSMPPYNRLEYLKDRLTLTTRESDDGNLNYVVLANFTDQGIRSAKESPKRAEAFKKLAETFGVVVKELFWTQGRYDVVTILDAPDEFSATALNLNLSALGNVRTESLRAFSAADMTKIVDKMF